MLAMEALGGGGSAASSNGQDNSGSGGAGNSELDLLEPSTAGTGGSGKVFNKISQR